MSELTAALSTLAGKSGLSDQKVFANIALVLGLLAHCYETQNTAMTADEIMDLVKENFHEGVILGKNYDMDSKSTHFGGNGRA